MTRRALADGGGALVLAFAIVLGALCVIGARAAISYQVLDGNAAGLVELARRCVEAHDCTSKGGEGRLGLFSGASWIRLTAYSLRAGGDLARMQSLILALLVLSAIVTFAAIAHHLGVRAATLVLGLYLPPVLASAEFRSFDNPNLFPFPVAIYYAGILLFAEFRRPIFSLVAAIALAGAISAYLIFLVLVPFHVVAVALLARRPVTAVTASCLAMAVVLCLDSTDAARAVAVRLANLPTGVFLAVGSLLVLLLFAIRSLRRIDLFGSVSTSRRVHVLMLAVLIYVTCGIWLASGALRLPVPPESRYLAPAVWPLLFLAAASTTAFTRRAFILFGVVETLAAALLSVAPQASVVGRLPLVILITLCGLGLGRSMILRRRTDPLVQSPVVATLVVCFSVGVTLPDIAPPSSVESRGFHLAEGEPLASALYAAGYTYPQVVASLHGPAADHLLALLAAHDPDLFDAPPRLMDVDFSLLLLKVPWAAVPQTHGIVTTSAVDHSNVAIVVRDDRSFLDWVHAEVCPVTGESVPSSRCMTLLVDEPLLRTWPYIRAGEAAPSSARDLQYREDRGRQPTGAPTVSWSALPSSDRSSGPVRVVMALHTPGQNGA